jgi:hypothetical protein
VKSKGAERWKPLSLRPQDGDDAVVGREGDAERELGELRGELRLNAVLSKSASRQASEQ